MTTESDDLLSIVGSALPRGITRGLTRGIAKKTERTIFGDDDKEKKRRKRRRLDASILTRDTGQPLGETGRRV